LFKLPSMIESPQIESAMGSLYSMRRAFFIILESYSDPMIGAGIALESYGHRRCSNSNQGGQYDHM